jgi:putative copper resistance protein D
VGLAATLTVLYYTPLLESSSGTQFGYAAMTSLALLSGCLFMASVMRPFGWHGASALTTRLLALCGVAVLYGFHGWALAQQPDQLPDARRQPWQISVDPAFDASAALSAEPAGMAMWILAAGTLCVAAAVVLFPVRRRAGLADKVRGESPAEKELVLAAGPTAVATPACDARPKGSPQAGRPPEG